MSYAGFQQDTWGILGQMEAVRQELCDRWPEGMTSREIMDMLGLKKSAWDTFVMQLTRYCFISEEYVPGRRLVYYVDPEMDERFERRILPYDRFDPSL